jgi:hypothetical protein
VCLSCRGGMSSVLDDEALSEVEVVERVELTDDEDEGQYKYEVRPKTHVGMDYCGL